MGTVRLSIPTDAAFVRLARLVASGIGAQAELSVDEIEDLRIAVDEMCTTIIETADGGELTLAFAFDDAAVRISGSATCRADLDPADQQREELSRQILDVVMDERAVDRQGSALTFSMVKYRRVS